MNSVHPDVSFGISFICDRGDQYSMPNVYDQTHSK